MHLGIYELLSVLKLNIVPKVVGLVRTRTVKVCI